MSPRRTVILFAASLAVVPLLGAAPPERCVEIVETTDIHGHLLSERATGDEERRGAPEERLGGLAWIGGYLRILRGGRNPVLLFDGGDLFQGTLASSASRGKAVIAAYDLLGYTASAVGNHEFDLDAADPPGDRFATLRRRFAEANFTFLAANLVEEATGQPPAWPHFAPSMIADARGLPIGIVGIANPDTPSLTLAGNTAGLRFTDPAAAIEREAARLRQGGARLIVLVAHVGGRCDGAGGDAGEASCEPESFLLRLLHALPPGTIDVALGGHNHQIIANWIAGIPALEAAYAGRHLGWLTACVRPHGGLDPARSTLHPMVTVVPRGRFLGAPVVRDAAVDRALAPYLAAVASRQDERLGPTLPSPITRDFHRLSPLGRLVAEAMKSYTGADVALMNPGGLRADLPAGPLTYGALYEALPFQNRIVVLTVTGRKLLELVTALADSGHGFPQLAGIDLRGGPGAWSGARLAGGKPLDLAARYRLATVDFLVGGGDGLSGAMAGVPRRAIHPLSRGPLLRELVLAYLERGPPPGR